MHSKSIFGLTTFGTVVTGLILSSAVVAAAPPKDTCTVSSIQLVGATAGTIDDDGYVTAGTPVTIKGVTTESGTSTSASCDAGTGGAAVTEGTIKIQGQVDDLAVPRDCRTNGVGSFGALKSQAVPSNVIEHPFVTAGLDETRGFRTEYTKAGGGSYTSSKSVCVDLTVNPSANPCDAYDEVVVLYVVGGAGKGVVAPGDLGPWSYTFDVLNCTGIDDLAVKVQGGTSGWTTFSNVMTAPNEPVQVVAKSKGKNGTTSTLTWHTILNDEEGKSMTVTVDGKVLKGVYDGEWLNISGAWSAAYNDGLPQKSAYTPQVYLEVVLP